MEIRDVFIFIVAILASYLLGGISIARFITSTEKQGNITSQGSGNPGTMNMLRTHGIGMGLFTLFCDALKGVAPALFGLIYFGEVVNIEMGYIALYAFGLFAVLGHVFPIYYKFKGGKGIATTFGIFMVADPICTIILFGILFITLYFIKIGSLVSLLFVTSEAIYQIFRKTMTGNWIALLIMCLIIILDIWCHRQNIIRIIENRENPADLQEGLKKDIEKIKNKRQKKLDKNSQKSERIENKYNEKIEKKENRVQNKLDKIKTKDVE
jgi:glycerol-3-phosphate acyltransferase PlsY